MKRLLLVLGSATLLNACSGKSDAPALAIINNGTGGVPSTTGGRAAHTGGASSTNASGTVSAGGTLSAGGASSTGGALSTGGIGSVGGTVSGGASNTVGTTEQDDGGTDDGGVPSDPSPKVKMTKPSKDLLTPDEDGVILDSTFDATCIVEQGASPINPLTVKIELLDSAGAVVAKQPTVPTQLTGNNPNEYGARFTLTTDTVQAGRIAFRCSASDTATPVRTSQQVVKTYLDYGPDIAFVLPPKDNSAYPLNKIVPFEFTVIPHPLDTTDTKSAVGGVSLQVRNTIIPTNNAQGHYTANVDFTNANLFPPGLSGDIASTVIAANRRTPTAATNSSVIHINLDGTPPAIVFIDPTPVEHAVIGGTRKICFTATDNTGGAGVNESTITVKLDSTAYKYGEPIATSWTKPATGAYCFQFNSTDFPDSQVQVTIFVSATDLAGNISDLKTRLLYLDNVPPFISLDPPNMRVVTPVDTTSSHCSIPFDPVGTDAANTGSIQSASGLVRFRAFVWERTNEVQGQQVMYYSGVDQANVHIYLRPIPDPANPTPVEVDLVPDALNMCDSVADDLKNGPTSVQTQLDALTTSNQGSPDFTGIDSPGASVDFTADPAVPQTYGCVAYGTTPVNLCAQKISDMSYVTYMNFTSQTNSLQAVYAVSATSDPASLTCTGSQWNISSAGAIPDGWVCVVAEAVDLAGNIGISAPLPICLDHTNGTKPPACASSSMTPPDCAVGCKAPSRGPSGDWDASNQLVPYDLGKPARFYVVYN
jgi:hypothetical protein